jgi:hypothetical protein
MALADSIGGNQSMRFSTKLITTIVSIAVLVYGSTLLASIPMPDLHQC